MDTLHYVPKDKKTTVAVIEASETLPHQEDELTILRDKKLWEQHDGFTKVPDKAAILESIQGKSTEEIAKDILADKERISKLHGELRVDDLTGLSNAKGFRERAKAELTILARTNTPFVVFEGDLNNMQTVNNKFGGHESGSAYIQHYADVLQSTLRSNDIAAHLHGDEFRIVASAEDPSYVEAIRQKLYTAMREKTKSLPVDHPMGKIKDSVNLEAALGASYQTWTPDELAVFQSHDKEKIALMIGEKMDRASKLADKDMYVQKAIQKGRQAESGQQGNDMRTAESSAPHNVTLWAEEDPAISVPTEAEVFSELVGKAPDAIADSIIKDKKRMRHLEEQLTTDEMTGLYNRNGFRRRVKEVVTDLARDGKPFAVMSGDINSMKGLNDGFGHEAGDAAIVLVGQAIKDTLRDGDLGAHPYGDETAVLLADVTLEEAVAVRQRIYDRTKTLVEELPEGHPLYHARKTLNIGGSFGISHRQLTESDISAFKAAKNAEEQGALVRDLVLDQIVEADINMQIEKKRIKEANSAESANKLTESQQDNVKN